MQTVKAVILKSVPYTEQQQIVQAYSGERGFMEFITPVPQFRRKKLLSTQCMQVVEIEYLPNERGGLHKLRSIAPLADTSAVYFSVVKMNIALLWGEVLSLTLRHAEPSEQLFEYVRYSVEYLGASQEDIANFNLLFLFRLGRVMGFGINLDSYEEGRLFHVDDACFHPPGEAGRYCAGPRSSAVIHALCSSPLEELKAIPLNQESRRILLDIALLYLGYHLNLDFNTRAIRVIREIFS